MKFKRSSLLVKLIILAVVVYAGVTLIALGGQVSGKRGEALELSAGITAAEQENQRLQNAIQSLDTSDGVKQAARGKLGLVESGEIVFYDVGS